LRSLRFRITSLAMIIVVTVLAVVALIILRTVNSHLEIQVDRGLTNEAAYVQSQVNAHALLSPTTPAGQLGQFFLPNGTLVAASTNLRGRPPLVHVAANEPSRRFLTIYYPPFGHVRVLEQRLNGPSGPILLEGQEINQVVEASKSLNDLLIFGLPALAVAVAVLVWFVVGRAMRPVEVARSAVEHISTSDSEARVPSPQTGDELDRLVDTMNSLLGRMQAALTRERQFVADASHELRSPIAALKALLENRETSSTTLSETDRKAKAVLLRLEILADDLLVLNRSQNGTDHHRSRPVDLDELVLSQAEQLRGSTSLTVDVSAVSGGQVLASEGDMIRIIENLSSNARRHAYSRIHFGLTERSDTVTFWVEDDGPGVPRTMRDAIFERFARLDEDRSQSTGGSGLGLAIVAELARSYGGSVWVEDAAPHGARFVLRMPASGHQHDAATPTDSSRKPYSVHVSAGPEPKVNPKPAFD
jgi:signal transduction histidine kinase